MQRSPVNQPDPALTWRDGTVPVSTRFDDPYYSLENGLEETRHVFLRGNDLPARFRDGFQIAELGFGTGLNFLAAAEAWRAAGVAGKLRFTSFELYPLSWADAEKALSVFPSLLPMADACRALWDRGHITSDWVEAQVVIGDARATLPAWSGRADAWFLDGFSPARNPELWEPELLQAVADHTAPGGSFATYTAAGHVRRGLEDAGFAVERVPGFGRKRHMTCGALR